MTYYYPQWAMTLRIRLDELTFQKQFDARLKQEYVLTVVPKNLAVNINDYTKADTFSCELDYKTFPFDPRIVRGIGVTLHAQDMQRMRDTTGPNTIVPVAVEGPPVPTELSNALFIGFADTESLKLSDDQQTISFEGRDLTSLFLDKPYPSQVPLPVSQPMDKIIRDLVAIRDTTKNIKVRADVALPTLSSFEPDKDKLGALQNIAPNTTYWEVFQKLASLSAVVIYMELDTLVITRPQVLYDKKNLKQFIWGKNINTLEFKRKIGRLRGFNVIVRCLNTKNKKNPVLEVKIPAQASEAWSKETGIPRKEVVITEQAYGKEPVEKPADYISIRVSDEKIVNEEQLVKRAEEIYEGLSRQEIEGTLETFDMVIPQGTDNPYGEFDALKIRNATPIEIRIEAEDLKAISKEASQGARFAYLQARGYKEDFANVLSDNIDSLPTSFYTKAVTFNFSQESGFKMTLDFINFIEVSQL